MGGSLGLREWWVGGGVVGVCVGWCGGVKGGGAGCTGMWDGGAPCERIEAKGTQTGMTTVFFAPPPQSQSIGSVTQSIHRSIHQSRSQQPITPSPTHLAVVVPRLPRILRRVLFGWTGEGWIWMWMVRCVSECGHV